jgi:ribonuclease D
VSSKAINETLKLLTSSDDLHKIVKDAASNKYISIDIEGNGFFRYPEFVCLIQLCVGEDIYLVDPLAIEDISSLGIVFADQKILKILHAGDYDIRSLNRDYGFSFTNVFDTSLAAGLLGSKKLGLDSVLKEYIDADVTKDKKLQRSDWTVRPLSKAARKYAADDVKYLFPAMQVMKEKLENLNRISWLAEECERLQSVTFNAKDEDTAFLDVKGSKSLDGQALSVLQALYSIREDEAIGRDRPPFKIVGDSVLVAIATKPQADYSEIKGIGAWGRSSVSKRIRKIAVEALDKPPIERPRGKSIRRNNMSNKERERSNVRLKELKEWRKSLGDAISVDPSLLWPTNSLNRLSRDLCSFEEEISEPEVRKWQVMEFGSRLKEKLASFQ